MPSEKYIIELSDADRKALSNIVAKGSSFITTIVRANILLSSDLNVKQRMTVVQIADKYTTQLQLSFRTSEYLSIMSTSPYRMPDKGNCTKAVSRR